MPGRLRIWLKSKLGGFKDGRARRRRQINAFIVRWITTFRLLLLITGYLWFLALPSPRIGRGVYNDENALQPSQVTTYWNWGEVHRADRYLDQLERLRDANVSSEARAEFLSEEFRKLGLASATQKYTLDVHGEVIHGVNAYAVFAAPRTSGTEAMVISASWKSVIDGGRGSLNMRGVAIVLSLASFLKKYSLWAKDIVFVIGDGYLDGIHAWLSVYHDAPQSNLKAEPLAHSSGVIWTALNVDYPGHSFSHLGVFHEGLNGRLPNQDLINSFRMISEHTGGVPVVLYDHLDPRQSKVDSERMQLTPSWFPNFLRTQPEVMEYSMRARNIAKQMKHQAFGKGSGVHGLYHRYRIDAITLFGVPAEGPHGFHSIGRVIESTLRTMNNLLERLHASFFFYLLTTPKTFLKIGLYLPAPIMISVALMFGGLQLWVQAGWRQVALGQGEKGIQKSSSTIAAIEWETRPRPVLGGLGLMLGTHVAGAISFLVADKIHNLNWGGASLSTWMRTAVVLCVQTINYFVFFYLTASAFAGDPPKDQRTAPVALILKSMNMCFASALISITSVLNFSLAAFLAILLGIPLTLSPSSSAGSSLSRAVTCTLYIMLSMSCTHLLADSSSMWYWTVLGNWFAPLMYVVYMPLLEQAALVCLLSR